LNIPYKIHDTPLCCNLGLILLCACPTLVLPQVTKLALKTFGAQRVHPWGTGEGEADPVYSWEDVANAEGAALEVKSGQAHHKGRVTPDKHEIACK
jgi:hypothetical protein